MKTILTVSIFLLSGCVVLSDSELSDHLATERDFHSMTGLEQEYISDCLFYEDLVCDFER